MADNSSRRRKNLTVSDICVIMKSGQDCGVAKLKFGELQIEFGRSTEPTYHTDQTLIPPTEAEISELKKIDKAELESQEFDFRKAQIEMSLIEDPEMAEKLLADGELEDDEPADDD